MSELAAGGASEEPRPRLRVGNGDLVNVVASSLGYTPSNEHVVAVALNEQRVGLMISIGWPGQPGQESTTALELAELMSEHLDRAGATGVIVLGYGQEGPGRALLLATALETDLRVAKVLAVDNATSTVRETDGAWWSESEPIQDTAAIAGLMDLDAPASDRESRMVQFDPRTEPDYAPASAAQRSRIESTLPSQRAANALQQLDALAAAAPVTPSERAALAHGILSHLTSRDLVIARAVQQPELSQALVQLYRGAPDEYRQGLAAVAGITHYVTAGDSAGTSRILDHAGHDGPHASLAEISRTAVQLGVPPDSLRRLAANVGAEGAAQADAAFEAAKSAERRSLSFGATPGQTNAAGRAPDATTPHRNLPTPEQDRGR